MKRILLLLMVVCCHVGFSQTKKKAVAPPKKVVFSLPKIQPVPKEKPYVKPVNHIGEIIDKYDGSLTFKYSVEKDTIILPDGEFSQLVAIDNYSKYLDDFDLTITTNTAIDSLKIEASKDEKNKKLFRHRIKIDRYDAVAKGTVITATNKETKQELVFKAYLNKDKKKILYLESVPKKKKYLPSEPYYLPPVGN